LRLHGKSETDESALNLDRVSRMLAFLAIPLAVEILLVVSMRGKLKS
jgi:hypothetical protein